ncbi:hypothetical protein BDZ91DRAFT_305978 [Kalaharituber pfeilii]|nr:hypothetical protein BDZ91DRAFT_305978 [Kalaharituber pfeilii]
MATIESDISNYFYFDGEALPVYVENAPALSAEDLETADAIVAAAAEEHRRATLAETVSSLFSAISQGPDDAVLHLLATFPNELSPNSRNADGKTALAAAVETGRINIVQLLINLGAEVDAWSVQGEYPLQKRYYEKSLRKKLSRGFRQRRTTRPGIVGSYNTSLSDNTVDSVSSSHDLPDPPFEPRPEYQILRTPLMIAANLGFLPIVKLLVNPPCNADASLCAPDGQIALRLAAENRHSEIVTFLPSLRKGGFRRFRHQHATSIYHIKQTTYVLRAIAKGVLWYIPKAILYDLPKWTGKKLWRLARHVVVVAIPRLMKALWRGTKRTCNYVVHELPVVVSNKTKAAAKSTMHFATVLLPRAVKAVINFIWRLITIHIPRAATGTARVIWKVFTKRIPKLIMKDIPRAAKWFVYKFLYRICLFVWTFVKWLYLVIKIIVTDLFPAFCRAVAAELGRVARGTWRYTVRGLEAVASFLHTVVTAIVTFFRGITLKDVWNGFVAILRWGLVEVPAAIVEGIVNGFKRLYEGFVKAVEKIFGLWGQVALFIWHLVVYLVVYVPRKLGEVTVEYAKALGKGCKEVVVWFNPKF